MTRATFFIISMGIEHACDHSTRAWGKGTVFGAVEEVSALLSSKERYAFDMPSIFSSKSKGRLGFVHSLRMGHLRKTKKAKYAHDPCNFLYLFNGQLFPSTTTFCTQVVYSFSSEHARKSE